MKSIVKFAMASILTITAMLPSSGNANVVITGTRIIYPEGAREKVVRLTNEGSTPVLIQAWVDAGDVKVTPEQARSPFAVLPSVFRLDPKKGQSLRLVLGSTKDLSADNESIYYLNVLEIPQRSVAADDKDANLLQIAIRTRIKLFYRPDQIKNEQESLGNKIKCRLLKEDGKVYAECSNESGLHASLTSMTITSSEKEYKVNLDTIAPHSSRKFAVGGLTVRELVNSSYSYGYINDYGAEVRIDTVGQ